MPALPGVIDAKELAQIAKTELNEDPNRTKEDIKAIQSWIKKQPHLHKYINTDDQHILMFLRGCKFSLERTKEKLDVYNACRAACPEWFDNWDAMDPIVQEFIDLGVAVPLKGYDKNGRRVMVMRGSAIDPRRHNISDQMKFSMMISEMLMHEADQSSITGFVGVQDMEGMTLGHATQFSPSLGKKAMTIWQDAYPQRPKGMHFLNMPSLMEAIFGMMKSFSKEKMRDRLIVHPKGDLTMLHEAVGTEILPKEFGGTNGVLQDHIDELRRKMEKHQKWFLEQGKFKSNEKKRPGKSKNHSNLFGMEGSFRQLSFD
ncbi:hypothetical protein TCAL_07480 [Tigriopus californicus]|uniref:CRAL-TRIO domain-containing protein n=1 Tax=Tigriopus californicus TaxID=6832 RepID=A0A553NSM2_TIGCA|nr:retinol-binding protein pinta-like [Tigriopus californicus]TRY68427.1 hypothetical protein TCAL_07480 [Tigriopus californicus]|eukprot:TCALIF_07480-PA protein Name:"Similar to Ttpal Alpha-tocopherol transfer protein-like (Mus musculus)" AED:0.08 eAED:0.08 QI:67/1/0.8/1/1/1/5/89/314